MKTSNRRLVGGMAAAVALTFALTGCVTVSTGDDGGGYGGASPGEEIAPMSADARFAMMMIPHHEQAVEMSDMLLAKDDIDERVTSLAERIKAAQGPEIDQMEDWLDDEGVGMGDMGDMGMDGMDHSGMMSEGDMDALEEAEGEEAARLYLEQMIVHHEGAIEMSEDLLGDGEDAEMRGLAESIVESQSAEIAEMQALLQEI